MFQNDFGAFMHVMDCTYIAIFFSAASDGATANLQIPDCNFWPFFTSLRKESPIGVANYAWISTLFSPSVSEPGVLCNALNVS